MASLIIHYCQACGRRIDKAEIRGGQAIQYRDNWYCLQCKDAASEHAPLDPSEIAVNPGLQTKDDEPEVTLSDLFGAVAAAAPRRATTARKVAPPRQQTASARRSPGAKAPAERPALDGSTAVRKAKAAAPSRNATGRARPTPDPPTPRTPEPDPGSGRKARGSDTPAPEPRAPGRIPSWMPPVMGGTILALLAVIVFLLARQAPTPVPPIGAPRPADPPGAGSPAAPPPADPALVRAVEELERADAAGAGRWRSRREGWAGILGRAAGTALEPRVRECLARLDQEIDRQARLQLDALKASAEPFVDAGRTEEAVVRLESFDEELRTPRWQGILDAEIARIRALGK